MPVLKLATQAGVLELDDFTRAYIEAALWSSMDSSTPQGGEPLDANYSVEDIAPEAMRTILADCEKFQHDNQSTLNEALCTRRGGGCSQDAQAGHDFWLTRNHHGAGFWDGDWNEPQAAQLTKAAQAFRECDIYIGDDGKLYV